MNSRHTLRELLILALINSLVIWMIQPGVVGTAQTLTGSRQDIILRSSPARQPKADLKTAFASEIGGLKAATTKVDSSRIQTAGHVIQPSGTFTKRQKIFLALWIVCITGLVIVLIKHPCKAKDPKDCEPIDDTSSF